MINISKEQKEAFKDSSNNHEISIRFYNSGTSIYFPSSSLYPSSSLFPDSRGTVVFEATNEQVVSQSMSLYEGISKSDVLNFTDSYASQLSVSIYSDIVDSMGIDLVGMDMCVYIDDVPLFNGYIDSTLRVNNGNVLSITAYDYLFYKFNVDVTAFLNGLTYPISCKELRISLCHYFNVGYTETPLINDNVLINLIDTSIPITGRQLLNMISEMNASFLIIDRYNRIDFRNLIKVEWILPSSELFPGATLPGLKTAQIDYDTAPFVFDYDQSVFNTREISRMEIRKEDELLVSVGSGDNMLVINDNKLINTLTDTVLTGVASTILSSIGTYVYSPASMSTIGLPYLECGDYISWNVTDQTGANRQYGYTILERELRGICSLRDSLIAKGTEYHTKARI